MNKVKFLLFISFLITSFLFLSFSSTSAHASIIDDIKAFFSKDKNDPSKKEFTIDTDIALAPGGDINKNGQVDAGDSIKFSYTITNPTGDTFQLATLETNVNTKEINSISNVQGVLSLDVGKDTVSIPNLNIEPNQVRKISFNARINFYKDSDQSISTEAELVDNSNASIFKAKKQEVTAKKMDTELFNKFVHISN